jgi:hypothetical protein
VPYAPCESAGLSCKETRSAMACCFPSSLAEPLGSRIAPAVIVGYRATDLDGSNGFIIRGEFNGDNAGAVARAAGDVNGDRLGDVIVTAP